MVVPLCWKYIVACQTHPALVRRCNFACGNVSCNLEPLVFLDKEELVMSTLMYLD